MSFARMRAVLALLTLIKHVLDVCFKTIGKAEKLYSLSEHLRGSLEQNAQPMSLANF